ncbi:MAG: ribonuclease HII [Promethearchaeota archaeon]
MYVPKGPVLGPLVICGVCFLEKDLEFLKSIGTKDSKKLSAKKRKELSQLILGKCHSYKVIIVSPQEIDDREQKNLSLNRLEELKMAEIINFLKPQHVYLDAADVKEVRFGKSIKKLLDYSPEKIVSKHKADDTYPIVSAASIIAKDKRDDIINQLRLKHGDIGSGYPSDEKTIKFLKNWIKTNKKAPEFARKTWGTTKRIINEEILSKKITDFI